ncbi:MAG: outer membrane protein assembly factor BamA [Sphingomonadaceae bacterium]|nr:outer membrane protein assembly factor BamA [Sphingomonadaceae bacterium]
MAALGGLRLQADGSAVPGGSRGVELSDYSHRPRTRTLFMAALMTGSAGAPAWAQDAGPAPQQGPQRAPAAAQGAPAPAGSAQQAPAGPAAPTGAGPRIGMPETLAAPVTAAGPEQAVTITSIEVRGAERVEPETVRSYIDLRVGDSYTRAKGDAVLRALYDTGLFADVTVGNEGGAVVINVRENPVVNRVVFEGAKRIKEDKLTKEVRLAPRQVFTRPRVASDVGRILELYRRSGRFAASVEPKIVQLEQNRVDVIFEIREGPRSKVRQINILGNKIFGDSKIRRQMATKQARWYHLFTSNDTYDPDRLSYDQQKLRQFYLTNGYADFRVVSATAELTPDRKDFIITYVVEEGERYRFGDVELDSKIRDFKAETFKPLISFTKGDWYNAQKVEDSVNALSEAAGLLGYAFADVRPRFDRDKQKREMNVTFVLNDAPRVYVERIDINGNTITADKVIRREFRLAEGDAFNTVLVKRSRDRIQSLGFFQDKLEVKQNPGSGPDRVILTTDLEDKPTGELQLSAGYSSIENLIINASIRQRNFRGLGQELRLSGSYSAFAASVEAGFTEPYLFERNISFGVDIFRRDYSQFRFQSLSTNARDTIYSQVITGTQARVGFPLTEYILAQLRYGISQEDVRLDRGQFYTDTNGDGILGNSAADTCDPLLAGRYLCDAEGSRFVSSAGFSLVYDTTNNRIRPTRGQRFSISQDVAGLGGDVNYVRTIVDVAKYFTLPRAFVFGLTARFGYIFGFAGQNVRLVDRFYLGQPTIRGFDIRGVGPRVLRTFLDPNGVPSADRNQRQDDAIGGNAYYVGRAELQIPLGTGARDLGLRPSIFADVGALWDVNRPALVCENPPLTTNGGVLAPQFRPPGVTCAANRSGSPGFTEQFLGDSPSPRLAVGAGVSWNSPFGPLRIDIAKDLLRQPGDRPRLIQFNIGGQF